MSSDPTMELLIERAREDYETCSRNLGIATAQRDHQQQKHRMLEEYREEYRNKLEEHASTGMDIAAMINYRRFLTQLDQAVEQQGTLLQQAEGAIEFARHQWQEANRRLKSYEILETRRIVARERIVARKEQNESDSYAQRIAMTRKLPF